MNGFLKQIIFLLLTLTSGILPAHSQEKEPENRQVDVKGIVFEHIGDAYEWHITTWKDTPIRVPLPVIVYSNNTGWHIFLSSKFEGSNGSYQGLYIAPQGSRYEGKIVEKNVAGQEVRPFDISITKLVFSLFINSLLLVFLIMSVVRWYKKHPKYEESPGGFTGFMEMMIIMVNDDIIKPGVGANYQQFAPYLQTVFFFILVNNFMGLVPFFPGGANVTGNIAVTLVLAFCSFIAVNLFASRHYWKDIFWPDVPVWLKVPIPMMPLVEFLGVFIKPFALMIRLFANMLSGHMAILVLICLIFVAAGMSPLLQGTLTAASFFFSVFMNALEVLVAFIQAYVFTMLSAVFIGLAQEK